MSKPQKRPKPKFDEDKTKPIAVVDIGSNSVRLVVYEGMLRSPAPIYNEKVNCGLGRQVPTKGRMGRASIERALKSLRRFKAIADALDAGPMHMIATAAAREATDGPLFIAAAEQICATEIAVLSGQQEAELAAAGVISGIRKPDGFVGDLGGGSLELVDVAGRKLNDWSTLPLGVLRLVEGGGRDFGLVRKLIDHQLDTLEWLKAGADRPFYAVGGTWRAFAKLHMAWCDYPLHVLHQYRIPTGEALRFARHLQDRPVDFFGGLQDVSSPRQEMVPYGAAVLQRLIPKIKPSEIIISATGIREGLLYTLLPKKTQKEDALLSACRMLSNMRSRSPVNDQELCAWTDRLFKDGGPDETTDERRLRHAACLMADIGWRAHPDYRGEHSVAIIQNAAFTSINHAAHAFLSLTVYYRHEGSVKDVISDRIRSLVPRRQQKRARIVGAALRAAHMIAVGSPGILPKTPIGYEGDALVLKLPKKYSQFNGERLRRRFKVLARELDRPLKIKM